MIQTIFAVLVGSSPVLALEENPLLKEKLAEYLTHTQPNDFKKPSFLKLEEEMIEELFDAPTLRAFYVNLFTINRVYIDRLDEIKKNAALQALFERLDFKLERKAISIEKQRATIRTVTTIVATIVGAGTAYVSLTKLQGYMRTIAEQGFWKHAINFGMRRFVLMAGVVAGGVIGYVAGNYGAVLILGDSKFYLDPIEEEGEYGLMLEEFIQEQELYGDLLKVDKDRIRKKLKALRANGDTKES